MLEVITLPVGTMQSNCHLVFDMGTKKALIIDPGDDAEFIAQKITDNRLLPEKIIATHGHFDHIMASFFLQNTFSIPFLIHGEDEFLLRKMRSSAMNFLGIEPDPPPMVDGYLEDGKSIILGKAELKVIHTPGHTPGSICIYHAGENRLLFPGDLIFEEGGVGRSDFSYSDPEKLILSLGKIRKLPSSTTVCPGHGGLFNLQSFLLPQS